MSRETKYLSESDPSVAKLAHVCKTVVTLRLGAKWTRPVARQGFCRRSSDETARYCSTRALELRWPPFK